MTLVQSRRTCGPSWACPGRTTNYFRKRGRFSWPRLIPCDRLDPFPRSPIQKQSPAVQAALIFISISKSIVFCCIFLKRKNMSNTCGKKFEDFRQLHFHFSVVDKCVLSRHWLHGDGCGFWMVLVQKKLPVYMRYYYANAGTKKLKVFFYKKGWLTFLPTPEICSLSLYVGHPPAYYSEWHYTHKRAFKPR